MQFIWTIQANEVRQGIEVKLLYGQRVYAEHRAYTCNKRCIHYAYYTGH